MAAPAKILSSPTARAADPVMRVEGLQSHYGTRQVLHDIDLTVEAGEIMVIMGGSGSGKSTLLRHMVGLDRPTAGNISLLGLDIAQATAAQMLPVQKKIGVALSTASLKQERSPQSLPQRI